MTARRITFGALAAAVVVVLVVVLAGGSNQYELKLHVADAGGLRDGSPVSVGGVRVGKVELDLAKGDRVDMTLHIDKGKRVPKDARIGIAAVNFLGQKQIAFTGGNPSDPAPDGYTFPASRVTTSTDLDQVLSTLDADTRTRLAILINETGAAVAGRRWDLSRDLQQLPATLADAHVLLSQLLQDNHTLADLVTSSDRFVASVSAKRDQVNRLIGTLGQTSRTVETKRVELAATLAKAPGTLRTLQGFLARLERTTVPLGPAAREIAQTAPSLQDTLARLEPFRRAADPTLKTATAVAPTLTKLGVQATPVLRKAEPTVASLARLAPAAAPLSRALDGSADNLIGVVQNWSRAIQLRDGLGHIFRGEAAYSPDAAAAVIDRLVRPADKPATSSRKAHRAPSTQSAPQSAPQAPKAKETPKVLDGVTKALKDVTKTVTGVGDKVKGTGDAVKGTLDALLGGNKGASRNDGSVQNLLNYLLGP